MVAGKAGERPGSTEKLTLGGFKKDGNGDGGPPSPPERVAMALRTLAGDARDHILKLFKAYKTPWEKMSENQQKDVIYRAGEEGRWLTESVAEIQSARGYASFEATLGEYKMNSKGAIEAKLVFDNDDNTILALNRQRFRKVVLVPIDAREFLGERKPALPDVVGDLGLPITVADAKTGETVGTVP